MFFSAFEVRDRVLQYGEEHVVQLFLDMFGVDRLETFVQLVERRAQHSQGPVQRSIDSPAMEVIDSYALKLPLLMAALNAAKPIDAIIVSSSEERFLVKGELDEVHLATHSSLPERPCLRDFDQPAWQFFVARSDDPQCFRPLGVLTFEFKNKVGSRGTAGTVERELWFRDISTEAKPESQYIVLHLHFEGTVAEYKDQKRLGKRDAENSALRKVTSLNVRHAVSAGYLHACANPKSFEQDRLCRYLFVAKEVGALKFNPYRHGFPPKPAQRQQQNARVWDLGMDNHPSTQKGQGQISPLARAISAASTAEDFGLQTFVRGVDNGGADRMLVSLKPLVERLLQRAADDGIMRKEHGTASCLQLDDELFSGNGVGRKPLVTGVHWMLTLALTLAFDPSPNAHPVCSPNPLPSPYHSFSPNPMPHPTALAIARTVALALSLVLTLALVLVQMFNLALTRQA